MFRAVAVAALCASAATAVGTAQAPALSIEIYDRPEAKGATLTLTSGSAAPCTFTFGGRDQYVPACHLTIPADTETLKVTGEILWKDDNRTRRARGEKRWRVADLTPLLAPVRDRTRPFAARVRAFIAAKTAFDGRHPDVESNVVTLDADDTASAADIRAAEKRLGYSLPPEHVNLLQELGRLQIDDSSTEEIATIGSTWRTMVEVWGTPLAALERSTTAATRQLFHASSLLYTEVGDGLGGLLYHPNLPRCGGRPAFLFVHQDGIDEPAVLEHGAGQCMDYTDAMLWLLRTQALLQYEDADSEYVFVDRSAPGPLRFRLERRSSDAPFDFNLTPTWSLWP